MDRLPSTPKGEEPFEVEVAANQKKEEETSEHQSRKCRKTEQIARGRQGRGLLQGAVKSDTGISC